MEHAITIPLLNPNEPDGILVALHVGEGQAIATGDLVFTLETTKATADIIAEASGYVIGLQFAAGDSVRAGDVLGYIASSADWQPPQAEQVASGARMPVNPPGLRISQPALALAQQHNIDLTQLPIGPLITEKTIRSLVGQTGPPSQHNHPERASLLAPPFAATAILVYGGGGHGKALIDLLRTLGAYQIAGIIDDGRTVGERIMGVPVLGGSSALPEMYAKGVRLAVNAIGGISNLQTRIKVFHQLAEAGFACPALVHPTAFIEASARLSPGVQVFPHAYVGSDVQVGYGAIVNTGAILSHDCQIGDYANLSPGAILAGGVKIGERSLIGMGVTINLNVIVGARARIGNGATIKGDVPEAGIVRAGNVFPN
ncbi:MAG: NeuD/PglB/VioB family sugar acetyltransferase [Chloroflexota bacterium]